MILPNYIKGYSQNTPRMVLTGGCEKDLNQWFRKKGKKNFIYNGKHVEGRKGKSNHHHHPPALFPEKRLEKPGRHTD